MPPESDVEKESAFQVITSVLLTLAEEDVSISWMPSGCDEATTHHRPGRVKIHRSVIK